MTPAAKLQSVGLVGIGNVGHGIGKNLLRAGFALYFVAHRNEQRAARLTALGGVCAATAAQLAGSVRMAVLSLPGAPEVEAVVAGSGGLLDGAAPGFVVVDCSTSAPHISAKLADECVSRQVHFLDAAVGRTAKEAEEGRLNLMVGGSEAALALARSALSAFAENIFHMGPAGSGHAMKLINNYLALTHAVAASESLALARRSGIDPRRLFEVIGSGGLDNRFFRSLVEPALSGNPDGIDYSLELAELSIGYFNAYVRARRESTAFGEPAERYIAEAAARAPSANLGALMTG